MNQKEGLEPEAGEDSDIEWTKKYLVLRTKKKLNTLKDIFSLHNGLKYILKEPPIIFKHTY